MSMPYEPPPDYPMVESRWRSNEVCYDRYSCAQDSHYFDQPLCRYRLPPRHHHCPPEMLLRTRQFPEVAGIYGYDEQPALRRFTRYSHSMMETPTMAPAPAPQPPPPSTSTAFSKRDDRPVSMNLSESRSGRSKSETAVQRQSDVRVPVMVQKTVDKVSESTMHTMPESSDIFTTSVMVDDRVTVLRPKKEQDIETNNNRCTCTSSLDDVASLLIGYDLRGKDLLLWDHHCLSQLGVTSASIREKILSELATIRERGPEDVKEIEKKTGHRALFDIVRQSSYDQVLAVETPLTNRDIVVTHGRLGCLQITKVNGVNLPLRENDCLLEINDCPGEQFKSALMLTKLISDANGAPIRFVVLRMKTIDRLEDGSNEASSSGVSSSPRSPSD
ncbi:hypothetical protein Angca_004432 [Angiostrongylus cantonensis]|nr:hypothetical protein Angca_004432 [Angiostrongylus cantonensis]